MEARENGFKIYTTDKLTVIYQGGPKNTQEIKNFAVGFTDQAESFKQRWEIKSPGGINIRHYIALKRAGRQDCPRRWGYISGGYPITG